MDKTDFKKLRIQDFLSVSRVLAAMVLVVLAIWDVRSVFAWLLLAGLLTDALDGYIARKRNDTTRHGAHLDSIGDASIFLAAIAGVIIFETTFFAEHLYILLLAFGFYFLQLGLAFWRYGKPSSFHTYSAKTAAVIQGIFLVSTSFFGPWEWLFYIAIAISILETIEEIVLIFMFREPVTNVKGLYWVLRDGRESFE